MEREKEESYFDDLLKEFDDNSVDYDMDFEESTSTEEDFESISDSFAIDELDWDNISFDDEIDFDEMDLSNTDSENFDEILNEVPEEMVEPLFENKEMPSENLQEEVQEIQLDDLFSAEEPLILEEIPAEELVAQEESIISAEPEEPSLDNIVENLLDNLDNTGSLENIEPKENIVEGMESETMDDLEALMNSLTQEDTKVENMEDGGEVDDLLSLLSDTDFNAVMDMDEAENPLDAEEGKEDLFSLDAMLSDLGDLDDIEELDSIEEIGGDIDDLADLSTDTPNTEEDNELNLVLEDLDAIDQKKKRKKKKEKDTEKISIFQKLFGNIHDEKARKSQEAALKKQEEKEKKKKPKKTKEELEEEKKLKAQEKKEKLDAAKKIKEAKKKEKDELKRKKQEEKAQEEEIDEGRINRVGATLVFAFFGILGAVILLGSKGFAYSSSISKATNHFEIQEYNEAYDEVRGVEVKEDDREIYDKIMTVMFVNKQLNSYNNYYSLKMYPEALDSLLKGLKRYEEYISYAKELGIESDMDYVRNQLLSELKEMYEMSEKDAYKIIEVQDQEEYSKLVIEEAN